jgi:hypothetical protein
MGSFTESYSISTKFMNRRASLCDASVNAGTSLKKTQSYLKATGGKVRSAKHGKKPKFGGLVWGLRFRETKQKNKVWGLGFGVLGKRSKKTKFGVRGLGLRETKQKTNVSA